MGQPDDRNFATIWEGLADALGDRPAVRQGASTLTWAEWDDAASRVAGWLESEGIGEGDHVALVTYNCPEMFTVVFAAFKLRAVPVAFNYRYLANEVAEVLEDAAARVVVFHTSLADRIGGARELLGGDRRWVGLDDGAACPAWALPFEELLQASPAARRPRRTDDRLVQYTGGTTGRPKGVLWTHEQILRAATLVSYLPLGIGLPDTVDEIVRIGVEQATAGAAPVNLVSVPLMHGTGLWQSFAAFQVGGSQLLLEGRSFDAAELLRLVGEHGVRSVVLVGDAFAKPIVEELERAADAGTPYDLASLEGVTSSGVAFSAPLKRRFLAHAPNALILEAVGASEGGPLATSLTFPGTDPADTSVFTASAETVLIDGDRIVPWGTEGVFHIGYGGSFATGYLNDPERTATTFRTIDGHRYLVTGDMGSIAEDGTLTFVGRGNTVINTGGEKVFPFEVEEVLKLHPGVQDCTVVGVPDERLGSAVAAIVAPAGDADLGLEEVQQHVKAHLAGYKAPRHLVLVDEVRRSAAGKLDYRWAARVAGEWLAGAGG